MEVMTDGTLYDLLQVETSHPNSPLGLYSLADAVEWLIQVADAMHYLHSRQPMLIHRDLKLENVLLARERVSGDGSSRSGGAASPGMQPVMCGGQPEERYIVKIGDVGLLVAVDPVTGKKVDLEALTKQQAQQRWQQQQRQQQQQQHRNQPQPQAAGVPLSHSSSTGALTPTPLSPAPLAPAPLSPTPLSPSPVSPSPLSPTPLPIQSPDTHIPSIPPHDGHLSGFASPPMSPAMPSMTQAHPNSTAVTPDSGPSVDRPRSQRELQQRLMVLEQHLMMEQQRLLQQQQQQQQYPEGSHSQTPLPPLDRSSANNTLAPHHALPHPTSHTPPPPPPSPPSHTRPANTTTTHTQHPTTTPTPIHHPRTRSRSALLPASSTATLPTTATPSPTHTDLTHPTHQSHTTPPPSSSGPRRSSAPFPTSTTNPTWNNPTSTTQPPPFAPLSSPLFPSPPLTPFPPPQPTHPPFPPSNHPTPIPPQQQVHPTPSIPPSIASSHRFKTLPHTCTSHPQLSLATHTPPHAATSPQLSHASAGVDHLHGTPPHAATSPQLSHASTDVDHLHPTTPPHAATSPQLSFASTGMGAVADSAHMGRHHTAAGMHARSSSPQLQAPMLAASQPSPHTHPHSPRQSLSGPPAEAELSHSTPCRDPHSHPPHPTPTHPPAPTPAPTQPQQHSHHFHQPHPPPQPLPSTRAQLQSGHSPRDLHTRSCPSHHPHPPTHITPTSTSHTTPPHTTPPTSTPLPPHPMGSLPHFHPHLHPHPHTPQGHTHSQTNTPPHPSLSHSKYPSRTPGSHSEPGTASLPPHAADLQPNNSSSSSSHTPPEHRKLRPHHSASASASGHAAHSPALSTLQEPAGTRSERPHPQSPRSLHYGSSHHSSSSHQNRHTPARRGSALERSSTHATAAAVEPHAPSRRSVSMSSASHPFVLTSSSTLPCSMLPHSGHASESATDAACDPAHDSAPTADTSNSSSSSSGSGALRRKHSEPTLQSAAAHAAHAVHAVDGARAARAARSEPPLRSSAPSTALTTPFGAHYAAPAHHTRGVQKRSSAPLSAHGAAMKSAQGTATKSAAPLSAVPPVQAAGSLLQAPHQARTSPFPAPSLTRCGLDLAPRPSHRVGELNCSLAAHHGSLTHRTAEQHSPIHQPFGGMTKGGEGHTDGHIDGHSDGHSDHGNFDPPQPPSPPAPPCLNPNPPPPFPSPPSPPTHPPPPSPPEPPSPPAPPCPAPPPPFWGKQPSRKHASPQPPRQEHAASPPPPSAAAGAQLASPLTHPRAEAHSSVATTPEGCGGYLPSAQDRRFTLTGRCGSVLYMSPEVARGKPYNEKADVFSFAVMAWELLGRCLLSSCLAAGDADALLDHIAKVAWQGWRPSLPSFWPTELKLLVSLCWHDDPRLRPSFAVVHAKLKAMQACNDVALLVSTEAPLLGTSHHPARWPHASTSAISSVSGSGRGHREGPSKQHGVSPHQYHHHHQQHQQQQQHHQHQGSQQYAQPQGLGSQQRGGHHEGGRRNIFSKLMPGKLWQGRHARQQQQQESQQQPQHQDVKRHLMQQLEQTKAQMKEQLSTRSLQRRQP